MEPIAKQLKDYLATIGFNKKKTRIDIQYEHKLVGDDLKHIAHITIDGPIDD